MFEFLFAAPYAMRMVGRDDFDWGFVSTAAVNDGRDPYETAVEHVAYNTGKMVIVESYATKEAAENGHSRWVATMTGELPDRLVDCNNSQIQQLCSALGEDADYPLET